MPGSTTATSQCYAMVTSPSKYYRFPNLELDTLSDLRSARRPLTPHGRSGGPYHVTTQFYYCIRHPCTQFKCVAWTGPAIYASQCNNMRSVTYISGHFTHALLTACVVYAHNDGMPRYFSSIFMAIRNMIMVCNYFNIYLPPGSFRDG